MIDIIIMMTVILLFTSGCVWKHRESKRLWNNGACQCGEGFWVSFDMCSGGETGYKCTSCNNSIWV